MQEMRGFRLLTTVALILGAPGCLDWTRSSPASDAGAAPTGGDAGAGFEAGGGDVPDAAAADGQTSSDAASVVSDGASEADDGGPALNADAGEGGVPQSSSGAALVLHMEEALWTGAANEVEDSSGYGHNATRIDTATTAAEGRFGRGGVFAGGYLTVADTPTLRPDTALTVSAWFKSSDYSANVYAGVVAKRLSPSDQASFAIHVTADAHLEVDVVGDDNRFKTQGALTANAWHHVVLVYDGSVEPSQRVRLYLDGALDTTAFESSAAIPASYTAALEVGRLVNGGGVFRGTIDEVAVWTRVLTPGEVSSLHDAAPRP